jgi:hypothetical protein
MDAGPGTSNDAGPDAGLATDSDAGPDGGQAGDAGAFDAGSCGVLAPAMDAGLWDEHSFELRIDVRSPSDAGPWIAFENPDLFYPDGGIGGGIDPDASVGSITTTSWMQTTSNGVRDVTIDSVFAAGIDPGNDSYGLLVLPGDGLQPLGTYGPWISDLLADLGVAEPEVNALHLVVDESPPPTTLFQLTSIQATLKTGDIVTSTDLGLPPAPDGGVAGVDQLIPMTGTLVSDETTLLGFLFSSSSQSVWGNGALLRARESGSVTSWSTTSYFWRSNLLTVTASAWALGPWGPLTGNVPYIQLANGVGEALYGGDVIDIFSTTQQLSDVLAGVGVCPSDVVWIGYVVHLERDPMPAFLWTWQVVLANGQSLAFSTP